MVNCLLRAAAEVHRVAAGGDILDTFREDGTSKHGSGGSTVTSKLIGLVCNVLNEAESGIR